MTRRGGSGSAPLLPPIASRDGRRLAWTRYRFRTIWRIEASPSDVYTVLYEVAEYPLWWPEVRSAERLDAESYRMTIRSVLPYDLDFVLRRDVADRRQRLLRASMSGDLDGYSQWRIGVGRRESVVVFDEQVDTRKASLNLLAPVARPLFVANHALMMRHGEMALQACLAGYRIGRRTTETGARRLP